VKKFLVIFVYSALILSTLLVFRQVSNFDFVNYDDDRYVYENPHVLNGLTQDGIIQAFTTPHIGNWLPLTWLSFMLDCQLFGANPGWMHLINLLLHLVNTLLLFAVLKKMSGSLWPSAFVAAAFALHPMHVESVAWITERKDVLSTLFLLLALVAYVSYVRRNGLVRYLLTVLLFASGLLAKPMLVTLPFVLLLLDYWPLNRFDFQPAKTSGRQPHKPVSIPDMRRILYRIIIEKIPFFALGAVSSVITFLTQQAGGAVTDFNVLPLQTRIANAVISYATYIGKMVWPRNLSVFYPYDIREFLFWRAMLCALLLVGISFLVIRLGRKQKYLPVGWFWFVGTLIPVIGLVQSGEQSLADRYTYISYIGLFIMIAWGLPELFSKWPQRKIALGLLMVIVLTTLGICTHQQVSYWNNSAALFSHAIEVTQNNYLAHNNRGNAYDSLGRYRDAAESYKQAIRIKPDYAEAHYNLGNAYRNLGRYQEAMESYKQAIRVKPDYAKAYYNLGNACRNLGRYQEAIESYKQAIRVEPDDAEAHYNLGVTYSGLGRYQEAIESYKQAIRIKPDDAETHYNLGNANRNLGRYQEAIESYKQAIRIKPVFAMAHYNLGAAYGNLGRYQDAVEAFKQAVRIKPDDAEAHYNLGNAYLLSGNKESALEEYKILKTLDAELANKLFNLIDAK
jgi:protein O-mannosyl-transferase